MKDITRYNKAMQENDLSKRKGMLQTLCLKIGWHGEAWYLAMQGLDRLESIGVKSGAQKYLAEKNTSAK